MMPTKPQCDLMQGILEASGFVAEGGLVVFYGNFDFKCTHVAVTHQIRISSGLILMCAGDRGGGQDFTLRVDMLSNQSFPIRQSIVSLAFLCSFSFSLLTKDVCTFSSTWATKNVSFLKVICTVKINDEILWLKTGAVVVETLL